MSTEDEEEESRRCYERYRILVQNECAGGERFCLCLEFLSHGIQTGYSVMIDTCCTPAHTGSICISNS